VSAKNAARGLPWDLPFKNAAHALSSYRETCPLQFSNFCQEDILLGYFPFKNAAHGLYSCHETRPLKSLFFVRRKFSGGKSQDEGPECALQMLQVDYHCRQEYVYLKTGVVDPDQDPDPSIN
jgi:hypothetical protein